MSIEWLVMQQTERKGLESPSHPVLLMSRIRLARNLAGYSFPGWAKPAQRQAVYDTCKEAVAAVSQMSSSAHFEVGGLNDMEKQLLVEKHLISKELCESRGSSGVTIAQGQLMAVMINEEDHLRIQVMRPDLDFDALWSDSSALDDELEKRLDYAFSPELGYLTACPTNLGTALRASAMLHLPALVLDKQMEKVVRAMNQIGIVARGLFGEASDPSGSVFQISNQQTLGESETVIIRRIEDVIRVVISHEWKARIRLFQGNAVKMFDRIGRAYGILRGGHLISSSEAMNLLSMMRLASDVHMLPVQVRDSVDRLIMEMQPAHLQIGSGKSLAPGERDEMRADLMRRTFTEIPHPDPSKLSFADSGVDSGISADDVKPDEG